MRLLWCAVYITLTIIRLIGYYRRINASRGLVRRPARWMLLLVGLMFTSVLTITTIGFIHGGGLYLSSIAAVATVMIMTQHIVLTFTVLRRGYVLYILPGESANETPDKISIDGDTPQRKVRRQYFHTGDNHLTRKEFDSWMRKHKPYLDHLYKLTDLSDALNVNRTYLSRFVNVTYGVNFNRYLNRLRLRELRRLIILPSNDGKPVKELLGQAGFYSMRQYRSILATEKENNR